ncbi:hypothetical protein OK016_02890 [Vibrio chagasii]|nr:hypothetical protein [Vibrio chagasii]
MKVNTFHAWIQRWLSFCYRPALYRRCCVSSEHDQEHWLGDSDNVDIQKLDERKASVLGGVSYQVITLVGMLRQRAQT